MNRMTLDPAQDAAVWRMVNEPTRAALSAADLGTGKTVMAVETARGIGARTILVNAPLHTKYGWADTFTRQQIGLPFAQVGNSNKAQKQALANLHAGRPGIYFAGREWFRLQDWSKTYVDMVIVDECHTISSKTSRGFKALKALKRGYTLLQSATPFGSEFSGAWAIGRSLWPDLIDGSFWRWAGDNCRMEFDPFTYNRKKIAGELAPGRFFSELPCAIRIEASPALPPVFEDVYVDLSPAQKRLYQQMQEEGVAWLREHPMVADFPIVRHTRLRQITLAVPSIDPETEAVTFDPDAKSSKFDALESLLSDLGDEKVLITTDSAKFAQLVVARLNAKTVQAFAWVGEASQEAREEAKRRFLDPADGLKWIVAHPAAIAEGTDGLQHASHIMVTLSESGDPVLNQQLLGRLNRRGQKKRVVVIRIRACETEDDPQAETLIRKELAMRASISAPMAA